MCCVKATEALSCTISLFAVVLDGQTESVVNTESSDELMNTPRNELVVSISGQNNIFITSIPY